MSAAGDNNRRFCDGLWHSASLEPPERFNTWPLVQELLVGKASALEVGPGLRPRLPLATAIFLERSAPAAIKLRARGARVVVGDVCYSPFRDASFAVVGAFDIIEHVEDDETVFHELARLLAPEGRLIFSVPLHCAAWTEFDVIVGHCRRYDPVALERALAAEGLRIAESAAYGMQPKSRWLLALGAWAMRKNPARAMRWYNHVFMPLGIWLQKPLRFVPGLVDSVGVDEIVAVCRR